MTPSSPSRAANRLRLSDHFIGASLAAAYVAWLLATARSLGFARDEGFYFRAASDYGRWLRLLVDHAQQAMTQGAIDGAWATNHEHPSLMKSLFSLSHMALFEKWPMFEDESTAFRFPTMLISGVALWTTYLFGAQQISRRAGIVAALLLGLMPRVFYNAHLACFDAPIMTMWTLCIYAYWRSLRGGVGGAIVAGVVYGLTLDTKHNAWIIPAVVLPHAIVVYGRAWISGRRVGKLNWPANLLAMATLGPLVFLSLWPWMWHETAERIREYLNFHLHHEYYNMEFLGKNYYGPPSPRLYAPVMIAATVPGITLFLFLLGLGDQLRGHVVRVRGLLSGAGARGDDRLETSLLWLLAFGAALGPWALSETPIFGGTKHWLTAYPFLALFAGHGFERVAQAWGSLGVATRLPAVRTAGVVALGASSTLGPVLFTAHSHPFGLSSYTPFVGGAPGAADLGLNRQFWGFTTESVSPYFEKSAPRDARVFVCDTAWDAWQRLGNEGRIRPDLRAVFAPSESQIALVHHELHFNEVDYEIWMAYGSPAPDWVLQHDGVPIVSVYKRR